MACCPRLYVCRWCLLYEEAAEPKFKRSLDVLSTLCSQHYFPKELDMPYKALALHDTKLPQYRTRYIPQAEVTDLLDNGYTSLDLHIPTFLHSYILHTGKLFNCIVESQSGKKNWQLLSWSTNSQPVMEPKGVQIWGTCRLLGCDTDTVSVGERCPTFRKINLHWWPWKRQRHDPSELQYSLNDVNQRNTLIFNPKVHHIVHTISLLQHIPVYINQ